MRPQPTAELPLRFGQKNNAAGIAPAAQFSLSPARCYDVFFGARVAIQPQTTSAIMAARKIPSSTMLILRRPAWGWHQVLRSNAGSLAALAATSLASLRV